VRALALGKFEDVSISGGTMLVIIVPEGGGVPSAQLLLDVEDFYNDDRPTMNATDFVITGPDYVDITVAGTITAKPGFDKPAVQAAAQQSIIDFFDYLSLDDRNVPNINFGQKKPILFESSIVNEIMKTQVNSLDAVENVTLTNPTSNISIPQREIPTLIDVSGLLVV